MPLANSALAFVLALPALETTLFTRLPLEWVAAVALGLVAIILAALWLRARQALAVTAKAFGLVVDDPGNSATVPTSGALAGSGPTLNKALNRMRGAQVKAQLHDQALATLEPEHILEASARLTEPIIAADGLEAMTITCVRFYRDTDLLAQSHSRLPDGSQDMVVLKMQPAPQLSEVGTQALRFSSAAELPDYLANLERPMADGELAHLDVIPLRVAPRDAGANKEVLGALALGRANSAAQPLRFGDAPGVLALSRSIAHALATCERKLATERLAADSLLALARAADATSAYTRGHSERVAQLAMRLGKRLDLLPSELERLRRAALLHDLGSVAISQRLLGQEESYDEEQRAKMRPHIELGLAILEPLSAFNDVREVIHHHHEWWNGEGYPQGLAGEDINPLARILSVVDVYEALTSTRPYRRALEPERALAHLGDRAGTQFEPRVIETLVESLR